MPAEQRRWLGQVTPFRGHGNQPETRSASNAPVYEYVRQQILINGESDSLD